MMKLSKTVKEKVNRLAIAGRNQIPDRVSITSQIETFAYGYGKTTIEEVKKNPIMGIKAFSKCYKDIYFDGYFENIFVHPFAFFDGLGADSYFASDDGVTAQHREIAPMKADEYLELAENPQEFLMNVINPRKFPNLNGEEKSQREAIKNALGGALSFMVGLMGGGILHPILTDTPTFFGGFLESPFDNVFDFLRGFKYTAVDLRRRPDEVEEAVNQIFLQYTVECEKIYSLLNVIQKPADLMHNVVNAAFTGGDIHAYDFPWFFNPTHAPAFLSTAQFERFYWPTYKKSIELINSWGGIVCILLEGKWGHEKIEFFNELEPGSVILYVDDDDICKVKKQMGTRHAVMGGMPAAMLKYSTKKECIDHAKRIVDECAPGGGFIFTTDKSLLSIDDAKVENLKAVNEFVHVYGQY